MRTLLTAIHVAEDVCAPVAHRQVVAFIEPPQGAVIEKILRHCGLWHPSTPRAPPPEDGWVYEPDADWDSQPPSCDQSGELAFVEMDEFLATTF